VAPHFPIPDYYPDLTRQSHIWQMSYYMRDMQTDIYRVLYELLGSKFQQLSQTGSGNLE
jgi:hypothetical protein